MKKILLPLLCLFLTVSPALFGAEAGKPKKEKPDTELEKSMDGLNKSWRKLRKQAADPVQNASSLELMTAIKAAVKNNLKYTPDLAREIPADKRAKYIAGYQEKMKAVGAAFDQVDAAFKAGNNPAAVELIAKISALQKEGHKEYKRPE